MSLSDTLNVHRGHDACIHTALTENIRHRKAVHRRGKHAHPVGADALHLSGAVLDTAPEIAAADHDSHFRPTGEGFLYALTDRGHEIEIKTASLSSAEGFPADFNQDSPVFHTH